MSRYLLISSLLLFLGVSLHSQTVDYSIVSVPEEAGIEFMKITSTNDYVCMPIVKKSKRGINWFQNRIIDMTKDGKFIAYFNTVGINGVTSL